mmetsp:Transcript_34503/g.77369  ORF Transcript_34503/g.77369 Transcript_34503/m.77369 type:complete len:403 (-) Transcript_34503:43-1251(-)
MSLQAPVEVRQRHSGRPASVTVPARSQAKVLGGGIAGLGSASSSVARFLTTGGPGIGHPRDDVNTIRSTTRQVSSSHIQTLRAASPLRPASTGAAASTFFLPSSSQPGLNLLGTGTARSSLPVGGSVSVSSRPIQQASPLMQSGVLSQAIGCSSGCQTIVHPPVPLSAMSAPATLTPAAPVSSVMLSAYASNPGFCGRRPYTSRSHDPSVSTRPISREELQGSGLLIVGDRVDNPREPDQRRSFSKFTQAAEQAVARAASQLPSHRVIAAEGPLVQKAPADAEPRTLVGLPPGACPKGSLPPPPADNTLMQQSTHDQEGAGETSHMSPGEPYTVLPIPDDYMRLIGSLRDIQDICGCRIEATKPVPGGTEWEVALYGTPEARARAHELIESTITEELSRNEQ